MKKTLMSLFMVLGLVFFAISCGGKTEAKAEEGAKNFKIGVTWYKYDDNFIAGMRKDMEAIQAEQFKNLELSMNDSQNSQAILNDQVDTLISKGVNLLAINLVDPSAGQQIIDKAKAANIPIILFNKDPGVDALNSYDKAYYVGNDPKESGIFQGNTIVKQWKADPKLDKNGDGVLQYAMLIGEPGHPDAVARTEYSVKTINEAGIKTEKLYEDAANWDAAIAKDKIDSFLSGPKGAAVEVIISNNDGMALGAIEAMKAHNVMLPIYGVDAIPEALTLIEKGTLSGTVLNDVKNQALAILQLANNILNGKDPVEGTNWKLVDKAVRVPYVGVDKDNYKEFVR